MKKKMSKCLRFFLYYEGENLDKPNFEEKKIRNLGQIPKKLGKSLCC